MTDPLHDAELERARAALDQGQSTQARQIGMRLLDAAEARADARWRARALVLLADCDRSASKIRGAAIWAQQAAHTYRALRDVPGEVEALVVLAHCTSMLGRCEESVESALLAVRLLDDPAITWQQRVTAHNYLGLAHCLSRNFESADQALDEAVRIAEAGGGARAAFQPRTNKLYTAIMRVATERFYLGRLPSCDEVSRRHAACELPTSLADGPVAGNRVIAHALWAFMSSIEATWCGDFARAEAQLVEGHAWAARYGSLARMNATEAWARTELAWARGRHDDALRHAEDLVQIATAVEHQQLACTGHLLLAQLYEQAGLGDRALSELRRLREREHHIRSESLESRARVVAWELETRRTETVVQQLRSASSELERLSLQDELTGIANRRCFERALGEQLATGAWDAEAAGLWIAYLDVDAFKQINDRHSHATGDRVLMRIARILQESVRENDLPARLGGDEFVVMFVHTRREAAHVACERITRAIASEDWNAWAPGLSVSASLGLARAQAGDTLDDVVHRSDVAMYRRKGRSVAAG